MARAHGSGRACYYNQAPETGSCEECRTWRREYNRRWMQTPSGSRSRQRSNHRYMWTAKGQLAKARGAAKARGTSAAT